MLVNITEYFIESGREWRIGENPDVPREVAARWIADGKATADTDGVRDYQSPVSGVGLTSDQTAAGAVAVSGLNANSEFIGAGGELLSFVEATPYVTVTTTTTAFTGACELAGFDVTSVTAGATVTIYDGTSTSGAVVVPTTTLSAVGRTEFNWKRVLLLGCHVVVTGTVSLNVLVG